MSSQIYFLCHRYIDIKLISVFPQVGTVYWKMFYFLFERHILLWMSFQQLNSSWKQICERCEVFLSLQRCLLPRVPWSQQASNVITKRQGEMGINMQICLEGLSWADLSSCSLYRLDGWGRDDNQQVDDKSILASFRSGSVVYVAWQPHASHQVTLAMTKTLTKTDCITMPTPNEQLNV